MPKTTKKDHVPPDLPESARRVKQLRGSQTMAAFAKELEVTPMAVSFWERGTNTPSSAAYFRMARVATDPEQREWFLQRASSEVADLAIAAYEMDAQRDATSPGKKAPASVRNIPMLRDNFLLGAEGEIPDEEIESTLALPRTWLAPGGKPFAVRVQDDSMLPLLSKGYIAVVDASRRQPGKLKDRLVAVKSPSFTIGWLRESGGALLLVPNHVTSESPIRIITQESGNTLLGEVVKWIGEPERQES